MKASSAALALALALAFVAAPFPASCADDGDSAAWNGVWTAAGTLFSVEVTISDGRVELRQLESLGLEWSSGAGVVAGASLEIPVEHAGVSGLIEARLQDAATAIVFTRSCLPEYRVVCVLAKDRRAVFRKAE